MNSKSPVNSAYYKPKFIFAFLSVFALLMTTSLLRAFDFHQTRSPTAIVLGLNEVYSHLQNLQQIAIAHNNSRSVTRGHRATTEYIIQQLAPLNATWRTWTEDVYLDVQVDKSPPHFSLGPTVYEPRLQVASARGSGSGSVKNAHVLFISKCEQSVYTTRKHFVAVIDTTTGTPSCSPCDMMIDVISSNKKLAGIVLINEPGNVAGYPKPLAPSPGRCSRNPIYRDIMARVPIVSLSDDAAFVFYTTITKNPKLQVDLKVDSALENYKSLNVLAESLLGDEDSVILFGSHLDSVPAGLGINDDGSGAMATLDIARAFSESRLLAKPELVKQKIRLAWWTGEEIGLLGSFAYVKNLTINAPEELQKIKLSIDTDMIASSNYVRGVYDGANVESDDEILVKGCTAIMSHYQRYFTSVGLPTWPITFDGRSDYAAFIDEGIPSGGLFTGAEQVKTAAQAELFGGVIGVCLDPCYHQDCDRVEQMSGSGLTVLRENLDVLSHTLELYATSLNITQLLS